MRIVASLTAKEAQSSRNLFAYTVFCFSDMYFLQVLNLGCTHRPKLPKAQMSNGIGEIITVLSIIQPKGPDIYPAAAGS